VETWSERERRSVSIVTGFVCVATLFNRIDVQDLLVVVALRPKTELADAKLRMGWPGQRFEIVVGVAPPVGDDFV
jgi:hypothetical protein